MTNISRSDHVAVNEFKSNDNIIITKADKGGQIVLNDIKDYSNDVYAISRAGNYIEVKKHLTNSHFTRVKEVLRVVLL